MHRRPLLESLERFRRTWGAPPPHATPDVAEERRILERFHAFVTETPACFERSHAAGHLTGSVLVVDSTLSQVLLTLHGKLGLWLQLGGHCDGEAAVHLAAAREAHEESGLTDLRWVDASFVFPALADAATPVPFDLDAHLIPARPGEPEHIHYDVRYLMIAPDPGGVRRSEESTDLRWFPLEAAREVTSERSMHRQFDKLAWLKDQWERHRRPPIDRVASGITFS